MSSVSVEEQRLAALHRYGILDTPPDEAFDNLTRIAAYICKTPIAVINFVDRDRQWFKSEIGLGVRETPLDISICAHAILQPGLFVVPDTLDDPRFASNPLVAGKPWLRFYAGALLETRDGYPLGTLCVLDYQPRNLAKEQAEMLHALARQVMLLVALTRSNLEQGEMLAALEAAKNDLAQLASTDSLTGLANRRAFQESLSQELARIGRTPSPSCLLMADLDHFKQVNDRFGHQTGDEALRTFAEVCRTVFRASDVIGRWGGEEFIVLLPQTTLQQARAAAERVHQALARTPLGAEKESFVLTTSIGLVALEAGQSPDQVVHQVDRALYVAKSQGRNRTAT